MSWILCYSFLCLPMGPNVLSKKNLKVRQAVGTGKVVRLILGTCACGTTFIFGINIYLFLSFDINIYACIKFDVLGFYKFIKTYINNFDIFDSRHFGTRHFCTLGVLVLDILVPIPRLGESVCLLNTQKHLLTLQIAASHGIAVSSNVATVFGLSPLPP